MKTKDFIKMLQEADPTGEAYIRLPDGGAPYSAWKKEGYWDGPYQYLEAKEGETIYDKPTFVYSSLGSKVDIYSTHIDDIIWEEKGDLNEIKDRVRIDYNYIGDEKENAIWKYIKEEAIFASDHHEKSLKEWTDRVLDKFYEGDNTWEIRQPLDKPIGYYHCMTAYHTYSKFWGMIEKNEKDKLCQGECMAIIESGLFYPEKKDEYYVWVHDPEKGKDWSIK